MKWLQTFQLLVVLLPTMWKVEDMNLLCQIYDISGKIEVVLKSFRSESKVLWTQCKVGYGLDSVLH